jgi:hypothetical protein
VRERQVALRHLALKALQRLDCTRVAVLAEHVRSTREAGQSHVHVVGRAPERAHRVARQPLQRDGAPAQILGAPRNQVRDTNALTVLGVGHQTLVRVLVLPLVVTGDARARTGEDRVLAHVHALPAEPYFAPVAQAGQVVEPTSRRHGFCSVCCER